MPFGVGKCNAAFIQPPLGLEGHHVPDDRKYNYFLRPECGVAMQIFNQHLPASRRQLVVAVSPAVVDLAISK
jgi:hypothetical protein